MAKSKNKKNTRTKSQPYTNKTVPKNVSRVVKPAEEEEVKEEKVDLSAEEIEATDAKATIEASEAVTPSETDIEVNELDAESEEETKPGKSKGKVTEVKAKDVAKSADKSDKKKKNKTKKPNKFVSSLKNTGGELKRITWPSFKEVVKKTGVVLVFVIVFAIVLFGFDRLCAWLVGFLY